MHAKITLQSIMSDKPQEAEDQHLKQILQESFSLHLIYPQQYCMKKVNPAKIVHSDAWSKRQTNITQFFGIYIYIYCRHRMRQNKMISIIRQSPFDFSWLRHALVLLITGKKTHPLPRLLFSFNNLHALTKAVEG